MAEQSTVSYRFKQSQDDISDTRAEGSLNDRVKVRPYMNLLLDQLYLKPYSTQIVVLEPDRRRIL